MARRYYNRHIKESELVDMFNSEEYWLGITSDWEGGIFNPKRRDERERYYRLLARAVYLLNPQNVLEVGCGVGYVVRGLNDMGIEAFGVDVSQWPIEHAVTNKVAVASLLALPFHDKEFDLLFSNDVLEHIPLPDLPLAITELERVGRRNYHLISCGSFPEDKDATHVTMHQLRWWKTRLPKDWIVEESFSALPPTERDNRLLGSKKKQG